MAMLNSLTTFCGIMKMRFHLGLLCFLCGLGSSALALTPAEMKAVHAGSQLEWQSPDGAKVSLTLEKVGQFKEEDGSWFLAEGKAANGKMLKLQLNPDADEDEGISLVSASLTPREVGVNRKLIHKIDDAGEGTIVYQGVSYEYQEELSSEATYFERANTGDGMAVSLYVFVASGDGDDTLTFVEWDNSAPEIWHSKPLPATSVHLRP